MRNEPRVAGLGFLGSEEIFGHGNELTNVCRHQVSSEKVAGGNNAAHLPKIISYPLIHK